MGMGNSLLTQITGQMHGSWYLDVCLESESIYGSFAKFNWNTLFLEAWGKGDS